MASIICKIYGVVDLISALLIYYYAPLPDIIKSILILILVVKGIPSLFA